MTSVGVGCFGVLSYTYFNMRGRQFIFVFALVFIALIFANYNYLDKKVENFLTETDSVFVERVIDGDTIVSNGSIRLLGINTPERGELYYDEAKAFLESLVLNKSVQLIYVGDKTDKYRRTLAYVFLDGKNVNEQMIENGYANYYFYDSRDIYSEELEDSWNKCIENKINLCQPSENKCSSCLDVETDYIQNDCSFLCNLNGWVVKGEGRNKIVLNSTIAPGEKTNFKLDLSNSGRTIFLRDSEGRLVFWDVF